MYFRRDIKGKGGGRKIEELEERRKNKLKQHGLTKGKILPG